MLNTMLDGVQAQLRVLKARSLLGGFHPRKLKDGQRLRKRLQPIGCLDMMRQLRAAEVMVSFPACIISRISYFNYEIL
jgi:hypothetical protein